MKVRGFLTLVALSTLLYSCGGGGGGAKPPASSGQQPPQVSPPPVSPSVVQANISGSVVGLSSLVGTQPSVQTQSNIKDAVVQVYSYDKDKKEIGKVQLVSSDIGSFAGKINLSSHVGTVVINVQKNGYADYSKTINYEKPSDINLSAEMTQVMTQVVNRSQAVIKSSTGERAIKLAVFKDERGNKVLKAGRSVEITKQSGQEPVLEISIPDSTIPQDIKTIVASVQTFEPSKDLARFPGDFVDSRGNRIVSLGFDYISLKDDTGRNLGQVVKAAIQSGKLSKAQTTGTTITRRIDESSCSTLLEDYCKGVPQEDPLCNKLTEAERKGFNVPIYTYNPVAGVWDMLGIATIDRNSDDTIDDKDMFSSKDEAQSFCRQNKGVYTIIRVSNTDFERYWWNLDYPLVFQQPIQLCVNVSVKDSDGVPLRGSYMYIIDDDSKVSFNSAWGVVDNDGNARLTTVLLDNSDPDRTAKLYLWDNINFKWVEKNINLGESPGCTAVAETVVKPKLCKVEGRVIDKDSGKGLKDQYVYVYTAGTSSWWRYGYTDENGKFSLDAKCGENNYITSNFGLMMFNPDGKKDGDEQSDDGTKVTVKDFVYENKPPYGYGYLTVNSTKVGRPVGVYIYGMDYEYDSPINWQVINDFTKQTVRQGQWNTYWGSESFDISFDREGQHSIQLRLKDSKGKEAVYSLGSVTVTKDNRAPVIYYAYPNSYTLTVGQKLYLYAYVYDPDGDSITCTWYMNNESVHSTQNNNCDYQLPMDKRGRYEFKLEVKDQQGASSSRTFDVFVGDIAGVEIIIQSLKGLFRKM